MYENNDVAKYNGMLPNSKEQNRKSENHRAYMADWQ